VNTLASAIRGRVDTLAEEYDQRLQAHPDYVAMPAGLRREAARRAMSMADVKHGPDLILLDIGLPHEDGHPVLAELRADPTLSGTRVVAVTANTSQQETKRAREYPRAREAGFDGFLGNPRRAIPNEL